MKTKDRQNEQAPTSEISGDSIATSPQSGILAPASDLLTPGFQEMKVQPEILMKTKDRQNEQAPTSVVSGGLIGTSPQSGILAPDSDLLTPVLQK